jgi:hypothetical protein
MARSVELFLGTDSSIIQTNLELVTKKERLRVQRTYSNNPQSYSLSSFYMKSKFIHIM